MGVIYHDLKPENILLDLDGHIKVVDFGLALDTDARQYGKTRMGTSMYMAPELAKQRVAVRKKIPVKVPFYHPLLGYDTILLLLPYY